MAISVRAGERADDANEPIKIAAFVDGPETEDVVEEALGRMHAPK